MLKVVGIVGSPRSNGNTEFMVKTTLNEIKKAYKRDYKKELSEEIKDK